MRIHSLSNSPVFGYNKELNEKVNKKLRKARDNNDLDRALFKLNTYCIETEDKLRKAEEEYNQPLVEAYSRLLLGVKEITVSNINERFPELDYRQKEYDTYLAEANEKKNPHCNYWLNELVFILSESINEDNVFAPEIEKSKKANKSNKDNPSKLNGDNTPELGKIDNAEQISKTKKKKKLPEGAELVEEFVPGEYSPKGFESIGGMDELKEKLYDKIIMPLKDPEQAKLDEVEYGKKMPRGELLYGPHGCGKTYFAEALAMETGLPMYKFKTSKVGSIYVDGKALNLQKAYDYLKDVAKDSGKPVIMFIDEMESLTGKRDESGSKAEANKAVDTFLQIMDEARNDKVFIIGATNLVNMIDPAVASRFDNKDYIGLPDDDTRRKVLQMNLSKYVKGQPLANNPKELEFIVQKTKGFPNRAIVNIVLEALDIARKDSRRYVVAQDFIIPIKNHADDIVRNEYVYEHKSKSPAVGF